MDVFQPIIPVACIEENLEEKQHEISVELIANSWGPHSDK